MKPSINKLENICNKFCSIQHNEDNFSIGGGLVNNKFASNRHENAKEDNGKLTLGEATQLFKKATGFDTDAVKEIFYYAIPNMEWHHAGKLPKNYGGGMKKTYFLNAIEICDVAKNWNDYVQKLEISKATAKEIAENKKSLEEKKLIFLKTFAKNITRIINPPVFFYETNKEMNGKHGWFSSYGKGYNMQEYFSGWEFETEELLKEFLNIK